MSGGTAKVNVAGLAQQRSPSFCHKWKLQISRAVVAVLLSFSAIAFTIVTYSLLWKSENDTYQAQYKAISFELLQDISSTVKKMHVASNSIATSAALTHPHSSTWPNASIPGYVRLNENIKGMVNAAVSLTPIVWPEDVHSFEVYAKAAFEADPDVPSDTAGYSDFGFGVFAFDETRTRYHDTTGVTTFSNNTFLTPLLMSAFPATSKAFLYNTHSEIVRGTAMDIVYECAMATPYEDCFFLSDIIQHISDEDFKPTTLVYTPIFTFEDHKMVGFSMVGFNWDEILYNLLSPIVDAVECVISTSDSVVFTIEINHGLATLKGAGDLHNSRFDSSREEALVSLDTAVNKSTVYTVAVYPTQRLYDVYHTNTPVIAIVSCLCLILVTMSVVLLYDHFIHDERFTKDNILKHKRDFVRFVSHEVRTPLNSVSLSLRFLEEEMQDALQMQPSSSVSSPTGIQKDSTTDIEKVTELQQKTKSSSTDNQKSDEPTLSSSNASSSNLKIDVVPPSTLKNDMKKYITLIREIQSSTSVAVSVLNDFLQYDKIEAGKMVLEQKLVSIHRTVLDNVKLFFIQASESRIKIEVVFDEDQDQDPGEAEEDTDRQSSTKTAFGQHSICKFPTSQRGLCVMGDVARLGQVVRNLVSNALKFSPAQSTITVRLTWQMKGLPAHQESGGGMGLEEDAQCCGSVLLSVTDSGPGLTAEDISNLFGEGVQFNPNELQGGQGSGLGLWISKSIVERHRGCIWAESSGLQRGCTFYTELPALRRAPPPNSLLDISARMQILGMDDDAAASDCGGGGVCTTDTGPTDTCVGGSGGMHPRISCHNSVDCDVRPMSVLVVDDAASNRKCVVRLLERRNYVCTTAEDGQQAVDIMQSAVDTGSPFDVILMDHEMPKMKGPEAVRRIRGMGFGKGLKIFGLTGNVMPEDVEAFMQAGTDGVLEKPLVITAFEDAMAKRSVENA